MNRFKALFSAAGAVTATMCAVGIGGGAAILTTGASSASADTCKSTALTGPAGTYGTGPFGTIVVSSNAAIFTVCLGAYGADSTISVSGHSIQWLQNNCHKSNATDCDLFANGGFSGFQGSCKGGKFYMDWYNGTGLDGKQQYLAGKNYWASPYNLLVAGDDYEALQHGDGLTTTDDVFGSC